MSTHSTRGGIPMDERGRPDRYDRRWIGVEDYYGWSICKDAYTWASTSGCAIPQGMPRASPTTAWRCSNERDL